MRRPGDHPLGVMILGGLFGWGAWKTQYLLHTEWILVPILLALFAALYALRFTILMLLAIPQIFVYLRVFRIRGRAGTAGWASLQDVRKAGLHRTKGFFVGMLENKSAGFVEIESSGLVLSPAGGGKTVSFVIPALCHCAMSMLVPDLKGILACMTAKMRAKVFKHKIIKLNPAGLYKKILGQGSRYNPLQILIDDWNDPALHTHVFDDARAIALQLCPDPVKIGDNQYWRNGARKFLVFAFVTLVTDRKNSASPKPTLSASLAFLSDTQALIAALQTAKSSTLLSGDVASLAKDMLAKYENGDPKQLESFREGAVQALEVFSASGSLAQCTEECDFRFSDMRKKKVTIYLLADPTRIKVYAPWLGLMSWCALTELIRTPKGKPVCVLCDEITNFKIEGLPAMLTLAREYKIILWLIVQELEEWARVYGRESLETLLSQTEAKIIMGTRGQKTAQLVSDMLGEESLKTMNHNLGSSFFDPVTRSVTETGRRLMTPDEVRRDDKIILFYRNHRPVWLSQIGYHQVSPWKRRVGINPLKGKRYRGWTKIRI